MIKRLKQKTLIKPEYIKPSNKGFKVIGVINPGSIRVGDEIYLLARVVEGPTIERKGYFFSPKYIFEDKEKRLEIESFPVCSSHNGDVREYLDERGFMRLPFISHLRLVKLNSSGFKVLWIDENPTFYPEESYEEFGVEDPRITFIDGIYYFTYVAVSKDMGVATALASTSDFKTFKRHGIIFCQENKDVVILPEKINGRYCAFHRPVAEHKLSPPNIQIAFSPDLVHWGEHKILMGTRPGKWDSDRMGAGTVPLKTEKGWLEFYHAVRLEEKGDPVGVYRSGAALFDLTDPSKLIGRSENPLLSPEESSEAMGFVKNVIFPTGAIIDKSGENIIVHSGGADTVVNATLLSLESIFNELEN
ncbi:MAG: glycoside hydrolase family 130 protein [Candidatus Eremiobacterota bacterium]